MRHRFEPTGLKPTFLNVSTGFMSKVKIADPSGGTSGAGTDGQQKA